MHGPPIVQSRRLSILLGLLLPIATGTAAPTAIWA